MSLPGPDIKSGLIRTVKNVVCQVKYTDTRLLCLKVAKEKEPTGDSALGFDESHADKNAVQYENDAACFRRSMHFAAVQGGNGNINTKDVNENEHVEKVSPLEEADNRADDVAKPTNATSSFPNLSISETKTKQNKNAESPSVLVSTKELSRYVSCEPVCLKVI
ncbi:hypothetical protein LZ30DRAFT_331892 [Colletotrichum cereale]|nr:hypothetical protein LZ30DRAFT_331892 [Colletotrichum cereale]